MGLGISFARLCFFRLFTNTAVDFIQAAIPVLTNSRPRVSDCRQSKDESSSEPKGGDRRLADQKVGTRLARPNQVSTSQTSGLEEFFKFEAASAGSETAGLVSPPSRDRRCLTIGGDGLDVRLKATRRWSRLARLAASLSPESRQQSGCVEPEAFLLAVAEMQYETRLMRNHERAVSRCLQV
ncbi:unnamed protein product, partial [Sphenostylis stenocarpa]